MYLSFFVLFYHNPTWTKNIKEPNGRLNSSVHLFGHMKWTRSIPGIPLLDFAVHNVHNPTMSNPSLPTKHHISSV